MRISLREARYHMTSLMADRKELSQQKRDLEERLGEASFAKVLQLDTVFCQLHVCQIFVCCFSRYRWIVFFECSSKELN